MVRLPKSVAQLRPADRGQAVVEMAIILPVMLYVAVGAGDFARAITLYIQVVNAANAGAQYAALGPNESTDVSNIRSRVNGNITVSGGTVCRNGYTAGVSACGTVLTGSSHCTAADQPVCVEYPTNDGTSRSVNLVTVSVSTTYHVLTPLVGLFTGSSPFGSDITISSSTTMQVNPNGT